MSDELVCAKKLFVTIENAALCGASTEVEWAAELPSHTSLLVLAEKTISTIAIDYN